MKKLISLLAVIVLCVAFAFSCGKGDGGAGKDSKSTAISSFSPSTTHEEIPSDATEIRTEEDLKAVKNDLNGKYYLGCNIMLSEEFETIGSYDVPFSGYFNGNGYSVDGLKIKSGALSVDGSSAELFVGLFACVTGTVEKLTLNAFTVNVDEQFISSCGYGELLAQNQTAVLSGAVAITDFDIHVGVAGNNKGILNEINASVNFSVKPSCETARLRVGALAGKNSGKITCCVSVGEISCESDDGYIRVGGTAGYCNAFSKVVECKSSMRINAKTINGGKINAGGIIGNMECGEAYRCYAEGSITTNNVQSKKTASGGLIGLVDNTDAYVLDLTTNAYSKSDKLTKNGSMGIIVKNCYANVNLQENTSTKKGASGAFIGQLSVFATVDTQIFIKENGALGDVKGTLNGKGGFSGSYEVFDGVNALAVTNYSLDYFEFVDNKCVASDSLAQKTSVVVPDDIGF